MVRCPKGENLERKLATLWEVDKKIHSKSNFLPHYVCALQTLTFARACAGALRAEFSLPPAKCLKMYIQINKYGMQHMPWGRFRLVFR